MENSFQTSFIPKKPLAPAMASSSRPPHAPTSIFTVLAFLLLIIMGASAGGLFLYKNYLTKQEDTLSFSLSKVRDTFEKDTLDELELYDKRVSAATQVLGKHLVFSPMFELLGNLTLPSIQYTSFSQQTSPQGFSVVLNGVATDYKSIALQADAFNSTKGRSFRDVVFSNLNKDKNNNVNFNVQFTIDPSLLSYEKNMLLEQAQGKVSAPVSAPNSEITLPTNTEQPSLPQSTTTTPTDTNTTNQGGATDTSPANNTQQ